MAATPSNSSLLTPDDNDENQLAISKVVDENNVSIINRITYRTSFKASGINAERNSSVWIWSGNTKLGEAPTNGVGEWETQLLNAPHFDCYSLFAEGQWADKPVSPTRRFTVATDEPKTISVHADGKQIEDNEIISATEVAFRVNAIPNKDSKVLNGEALLTTEPTNGCGICAFVLTDLKSGPYSIKIKASNDKESTPFRFTVIEEGVQPVTLDKVTTTAGVEVPDGTTTTENSLYVEGEAEKGEKVEVFKNGLPLGEADVDATTGRYKHPTGVLTNDTYEFTVTAKYAGGGGAGPHTVTVEAATTAPTETRIYDVDGNVIDDGGDINRSWLIGRGKHVPDSAVKIRVNGIIQPNPESTSDKGVWVFFLRKLIVGTTYEISALTLDEKAESNKWRVVAQPPSKD